MVARLRRQILMFSIIGIASILSPVSALQVVSGSKCEPVCSDSAVGDLHDDVRCLNNDFSTTPGSSFKECINCQLNSTAIDPTTKATDVQWALFNLRYALANCMFGYPEERVSISSPCQVTCAPLQKAVISGIANDTNSLNFTSDLGYCTAGKFDDTTINNCAFCYSLIDQQLFLGNFLQALHIACASPPAQGSTFYPDGNAIFNLSTIAGPTGAKPPSSTGSGLTGSKLVLAITLPIVGGLLILAATCFGCWHFTRKRRQRMAASGRMSKFHDSHATSNIYSPVTPGFPSHGKWQEPPREMERIQVTAKIPDAPKKQSPGLAQGRWSHGEYDEAEVPLNSADRENFTQQNTHYNARQRQDSHLHDNFIGVAHGGGVNYNSQGFRAQDGYLRET